MRVSRERATEHRTKIIASAARLFRERGIAATGVDSITDAAGLTHGAVYSQFGSKQAIAIESIRRAMRDSRKAWLRAIASSRGRPALEAIAESYLSARHRDAPGAGCLVAALGGEISRQPKGVRDAFTAEFKDALEILVELLRAGDRSVTTDDALAIFSAMAGAMALARAVNDASLSDRILKSTVNRIERSRPRSSRSRAAKARAISSR